MDNFEYSKEEYERNFILKKNLDKSKEVLDKSKSIGKQTDEKIKDSIFLLEKYTGKRYKHQENISVEDNSFKTNDNKVEKKPIKSKSEILEDYGYGSEINDKNIGLDQILSSDEYDIATKRVKEIESEFLKMTKLNSLDVKFLMLATALQVSKSLTFPIVAKKKGFGNFVDKETRLDHDDDIIKKEQKEKKDAFRDKYQEKYGNGHWINMLYQTPAYDITRGSKDIGKNMGGKYHRQPTLGHDPILGFIFGTANILTDTITFTDFSTNKVSRTPHMKITKEKMNLFELVSESNTVIKGHYFNLPAALYAQYMHLKSDINTKLGLPVPILSLINNEYSSELYKKGYDYLCFKRDVSIVGVSFAVSKFIDIIITILHSFFREENEDIKLFEARTRKILLYSNLMATTSSGVLALLTKNPKMFDYGSGLSTLTRLFSDIRFIVRLKEEFINARLDENLQVEIDKINRMYDNLFDE